MEGYNIELVKSKQFQDLDIDAWRMNTLILDLKRQLLVLGCTNNLLFFSITGLKLKQLKPIFIEQNDMINQIKQYDHLLFAITMNSYIYIYDLDNILIKPIKLQGLYEKIQDCSIWSIDICHQYLAVGSNSHIISLWSRKLLNFDKPDHKYWDDREIRVKFNKQDLMRTDIEFPIRYSIQNHKHNIPCVSFSPCCQFLASGSIDGGLRIYLVENGTQLYSIIFSEWVWCISWIQLNDQTKIIFNSEIDQLSQYNIVAGFKDSIKLCQIINQELKVVEDDFYKNSSSLGQRFQRLQYIQDLNLILAFPQHDKQFCLIESYNLDRIIKNQDLTIKLPAENLISADIQQIKDSYEAIIAVLTWQKNIKLYKLKV
ncbi:unnamed protein product [Paramecium pentaurelia]|uniref:Uncharacterized protein n=1 Tax=Paramecium pentaurelia TaxID=43138 RepID=A0A8S1SMU7_9CILI|nr:unnamed protein product [Paramecium pentaurelia]